MDGGALEHVALGLGRDADDGEGLAAVERRARLGERAARTATLTAPLASSVCTIRRLELAQVVVDDRDRDLAQDLVEIGLRVIDAVDQRRNDQQDESAANREHALPLGGEGAADAARHRSAGSTCSGAAAGGSGVRATARRRKQRQQRVERGERRERRERDGQIRTAAVRAPPVRAAPPCTSAPAGSRPRHCENAFMPNVGKPTPA